MLKVPYYSFQNYQTIIERPYSEYNSTKRIDFSEFIKKLDENYIYKYRTLDARKLWNKENNNKNPEDKFLIATKLLMPSLRTCDYFFRNQKEWTHCGIDIILPQGTPIPSFSEWKVIRIKKRDWQKKDEWNCIVIKTWNKYFCYHHLDKTFIHHWQQISKGHIIWSCGKTGLATQHHLHLQIDNEHANFHPYRSSQTINIQKNTTNPLNILREIYRKIEIFIDMPTEQKYKEATTKLNQRNIIKWQNNKIFPDKPLSKDEITIIANKIQQKYDIDIHKNNINRDLPRKEVFIILYNQLKKEWKT